jgi:ribose-phosphate pyrophosphokinase
MDAKPPLIISGSANVALAEAIAREIGVAPGRRIIERYPGGERRVELEESVRSTDVYLVQPTCPPVETNLVELLLLADCCRRAGAAQVTAVIPYYGYGRQDRRGGQRVPVGGRLVADLVVASGVQRVVAVDLHTPSMEGYFTLPVEHLAAFPVLMASLEGGVEPGSVVVAPDLGATKLADRYAAALRLPLAVIHKTRVSGADVVATGVTGDVRGKAPLIIDDMITTGGTIAAAVETLLAAGAQPRVTVVATHAVFEPEAFERLGRLPIQRLIVSDSIPLVPGSALPLQIVHLAPLLAEAIRRLHGQESVSELRARV